MRLFDFCVISRTEKNSTFVLQSQTTKIVFIFISLIPFLFFPGNYSTVTLTFFFKRRVGYYLIQVYSPDIFVVALSWIVFWMDKDEMGDRMALGITTILTIMFLLGSLNGNLPKVSYPKALDWYLLVSFSFVFMSLVECMIVFILNLRASDDKQRIKCKVCSKIPKNLFITYTSRSMPQCKRAM